MIAVLDSGIDTDHDAFSVAPENPRLTQTDVQNLRVDMHATTARYISPKMPFAFNYFDKTTRVDHNGGSDHGTHVSGICAGNDGKENGFRGVAPEAQIAVFKVMSDEGSGSYADILAGVEDAVRLGVDVINMSLGSTAGFTYVGESVPTYDDIYASVEKAGIFLAVAAGNSYSVAYGNNWGLDLALTDNPDTGTLASPGTTMSGTTVASVNNAFETGVGFMLDGQAYPYVDNAPTGVEGVHAFSELEEGDYQYVMVPGYGAAEDYEGLDVEGKIAVVSRGSISFNEKVGYANNAKAAAIIIYNNVSGTFYMSINTYYIPAVSVAKATGQALADAAVDGVGTLTIKKGTFQCVSGDGYRMSIFSSWGATPDLRLEPDITAVGGNVYSSLDNNTYGSSSGTSMACPNLAGCALLVRQYMKDKTSSNYVAFEGLTGYESNLLANTLLMNTAAQLQDEDGHTYSPRRQGAGLVQVEKAMSTTSYLTVDGMNRPKIELGDDADRRGAYTLTFNVTNFADTSVTFALDTQVMTESVLEQDGLSFIAEKPYDLTDLTSINYMTGKTVKVNANSTETVTIQLQLSNQAKAYLNENFANGMYVEGYVTLTPVGDGNNGVTLSLPYMGYYGDWAAPSIMDQGTYADGVDSMSSQYENCAFSGVIYPNEETGELENNSYFELGFNPYWEMQDSEHPDGVPFYADRISMTTQEAVQNGEQQGVFAISGLYVSLLRNAKTIRYAITDTETGDVYWQDTAFYVPKSYYMSSAGMCVPAVEPIVWYGTDANDNYLPDGTTVELPVHAELDYARGEQTWSMPITIDNSAPELVSLTTYQAGEKTMARLKARDNHYLAYILVQDMDTQEKIFETPVAEFQRGATTVVEFDVTGHTNLGVLLGDYAFNETVDESISPGEPASFGMAPAAMDLQVAETGSLTVYGAAAEDVSFTSEDESVATVDAAGVITAVKAGKTRICASYEDQTAYCVVTVTDAEQTGPVDPVPTNGDLAVRISSPEKACEGDFVTVTLDVTENKFGFAAGNLIFHYSDDVLNLVKVTVGDMLENAEVAVNAPFGTGGASVDSQTSKGTVKAAFANDTDIQGTGTLLSFLFEVADDTADQEAYMNLTVTDLYQMDLSSFDTTELCPEVSLTVESKPEVPGIPLPDIPSTKPEPGDSDEDTDIPFTDVKSGEWYAEAVAWAVKESITNGTSATTFGPNADCTRGEVVTFLWRAAGCPAPQSGTSAFEDVKADTYYTDAVQWAVEQGITNGTSATTFSPDATVTRGEFVTFLYRYAGSPATSGTNRFSDVQAGAYYYDAVLWAAESGVTQGVTATAFAPNATCTRSQTVTFLYRAQAE